MKIMRYAALFLVWASVASAALVEHTETYTDGTTEMRGYIVYDDAFEGLRPGVMVVHEWWGQNENARHRARMLAEQGYLALAVDMYGEGKVVEEPTTARDLAMGVLSNMQVCVSRLRAARALLDSQTQVDPSRVAVVGYCFGGTAALGLARAGEDVDVVASFHGSLGTKMPPREGSVAARVLVYQGSEDAVAPQAEILAFEKEMKRAKVNYKIVIYPGAKHAFSVPESDRYAEEFNLPVAYDANADQASWEDLLAELKAAFSPAVEVVAPTE
ncbi:MAG: dienelactone hydrolase family protein [Kiritimatiellae bacterium]|nr:dienelactone hydrolase family protein [Kiritimatiellia bacterium]